MTMTRRDFLSASAAVAATPLLGASGWGAPLPREADIVVIGAGVAGIAAARRIQAANRKVVVVEAASQVGGRCATEEEQVPAEHERFLEVPEQPGALAFRHLSLLPAATTRACRSCREYR